MTDSSGNKFKVSCVLPAYNEQECIEEAVIAARKALQLNTEEFEIIAVDDGSTDNTLEILNGLKSIVPELTVVKHDCNIGYGAALKDGFLISRYDLVFYTDSDLQFDITEIEKLLPFTNEFDIVTGYRIKRNDPAIRLYLSRGFNSLVGLMFRLRVKDINCAFKIFKRFIFDEIQIESNEFFVDTEILAKCKAKELKIKEVGVNHYPRKAGNATVRYSDIIGTIKELYRIRKSIISMKV